MNGLILIIDDYDYSAYEGSLMAIGMQEEFTSFAIAYANNIEEAYQIFFETTPALIIARYDLEGGAENLVQLKTEEMYRHIPVILTAPQYDRHLFKRLYIAGADSVLSHKEIEFGLLPIRAKPLLVSSALFQLKIARSSELQEKALLDFILLDLIKPYVSKTIWNMACDRAEQQKMEIKEQELEITMAFGDIKGFTTVSQNMKPKEVISFLNEAYEIVTRHVYNHNGDIDKFIGDAFFAVFQDAKEAITAMAGIQRELARVHDQHRQKGNQFVQFRIAVHSGRVIRGNVGSHLRFDNTLIGDAVNTASRLEHEAPIGGLLVSQAAALKAGLTIPQEKMQKLELRGRDTSTYTFSYFDMIDQGLINDEPLFTPNSKD